MASKLDNYVGSEVQNIETASNVELPVEQVQPIVTGPNIFDPQINSIDNTELVSPVAKLNRSEMNSRKVSRSIAIKPNAQ